MISLCYLNWEVLSGKCSLVKDVKRKRGGERGISGCFLHETQFCNTPLKPESLHKVFQGLQKFAAKEKREKFLILTHDLRVSNNELHWGPFSSKNSLWMPPLSPYPLSASLCSQNTKLRGGGGTDTQKPFLPSFSQVFLSPAGGRAVGLIGNTQAQCCCIFRMAELITLAAHLGGDPSPQEDMMFPCNCWDREQTQSEGSPGQILPRLTQLSVYFNLQLGPIS